MSNKHPISEDISLISDAVSQNFEPIQKDGRLFKFILYTTKIEIKFNSLIRLIFNTSISEISLWILGFLLFIASPKDMYLIFFLIVHVGKGVVGLILLNKMPKTFEILEKVAGNPNFDEKKIIDLLKKEMNDTFMTKWEENKRMFLIYLVGNILCLVIDLIIFITQICSFGKEEWLLMQTCMLFTILAFIISDVIYFLWVLTLNFTFPPEIFNPIKKAIFGRMDDLNNLVQQNLFKRAVNNAVDNVV